ncbi:MAG: hydroxyethylthiazole kinase [Propionibacteriaceae bacterium]
MTGISLDLAGVVAGVRHRAPLVHCITAAVSMNLVADVLLAAGARPMMTETEAEAPAMDAVADTLLVNLGSLSVDGAAGIEPTVAAARAGARPWVLDPAAVGVAPVRTRLAARVLPERPAAVRGNASEVLALARRGTGGRGADATDATEAALDAAVCLAREYDTVVAVSGAVDLITDGTRIIRVRNGHPLLTRVTGTGCSLGALVAACAAVADPLVAALTATVWLGLAGERAAARAAWPGSFRVAVIDELAALSPADVAAGALLEEAG